YVGGTLAFQILLLSTAFMFIRSTLENVFLVQNRLRLQLWIMFMAVGINVVLNVILIPRFGLIGASSAMAFSELLLLVVGWLAVSRRIGVVLTAIPLLKPLAASVVMSVILLFTGEYFHPLITVGIGAVIYVVSLILLGGIPRDIVSYVMPLYTKLKPIHAR
ncbi:MAG TPA: polysaccharide biosynthesis C-terminal domain-containing protein, partial [Rhodothermales bacterium]|nr:polysaccharide biosynthesis C-terminal domain-containing protein [Rhodothermales bacterium]